MKKEFIEKIIRAGVLDTRKYRYIFQQHADRPACIVRCPLEMVGTTLMLDPDNFTTVHTC